MKRIVRIAGYAVLVVVLLLGMAAAFTQTPFFRSWLREEALARLNAMPGAAAYLGPVSGNLVTGFSIDSLSLRVQGRPFVSARAVRFEYNPLRILSRSLFFHTITLVGPAVVLERGMAGSWNFARFGGEGPADSGGAEGRQQFDWLLELGILQVVDGTLSLVDSVALADPQHGELNPRAIDYHAFSVRDLNLTLQGRAAADEKWLAIGSLSFVLERPSFTLKDLNADIQITPSEARVRRLEISTEGSHLILRGSLSETDLLGGLDLASLESRPVTLDLQADRFDFEEFEQFLTATDFLDGTISLSLQAGGTFGLLQLSTSTIRIGNTRLELEGSVANLHHPSELFLGIRITGNIDDYARVMDLMPSFNLPDFRSLSPIALRVDYSGTPLDFVTELDLTTAAGSVRSPGFALAIGGEYSLVYSGDVRIQDLDVARVLNRQGMESRLSGEMHLDGRGVDLDHLEGILQAQLDNSEFRGLPVEASRLTIQGLRRTLTGVAHLSLGPMSSILTAELDGSDPDTTRYVIGGNVFALNLAEILQDPRYESELTMDGTLRASESASGLVQLNAQFDLSSSRYNGYNLDSGLVQIALDHRDPLLQSLTVTSPVADFALRGSYALPYLRDLVAFEAASLEEDLARKRSPFAAEEATDRARRRELAALMDRLEQERMTLNATYTLNIKNLEAVSKVARTRLFNGAAELSGWIKGDHRDVSMSGDLRVSEFFYGTVDSGMLILDGTTAFHVTGLRPVQPLSDVAIELTMGAHQLHLNRTEIDDLNAFVAFGGEAAVFTVNGNLGPELLLGAAGTTFLSEDSLWFDFDTVRCAYHDIVWASRPGATLALSPRGMDLSVLDFRRDAQEIRLDAKVSDDDSIAVTLLAEGIDLDQLKHLFPRDDPSRPPRTAFEGTGHVRLEGHGTLSAPRLEATVRGDDVKFRGVPVGQLSGQFDYANEQLLLQLFVEDSLGQASTPPRWSLIGTLPLNLGLEAVTERVPSAPMDLTIRTNDFSMSVLGPLVPTFADLAGWLSCDVHIGGTPRKPEARGEIAVRDCIFLFVPNNIHYILNGDFVMRGDRIEVLQAAVSNVSGDVSGGRSGTVNITGDFSIRDLTPGDFQLQATGDLLVVNQTTRSSDLSVSGNLFVEIASGGLRFTGTVQQSLLKGNLLVRNSSLVFPPTQAPAQERLALAIPIVLIDDTSTVSTGENLSAVEYYFGPGGAGASRADTQEVSGTSFIDGLRYDLNIEASGGSTEIRMIFNPITGEELVATLNGKFSVTDDGRKWFGDLIVDRAYYNFFKRFNADGRIIFRGDLMNPALDITARYRGTRVVRDSVAERAENVLVIFTIKGTRYQPTVSYDMNIDEVEYSAYRGPKSNDLQSDAIQFIVYGSFPISSAEQSDVPAEVQRTIGLSILTGATSMLTGTLSEFLRQQTGFINSVEFSYGAEGTLRESADIRLSGVAWSGYWRYGGKIFDDPLSNANFSVMYSFDAIFQNPSLRNLMVELERSVEDVPGAQRNDLKRVNSARLFYRFSF
jgi:hypothetical protein